MSREELSSSTRGSSDFWRPLKWVSLTFYIESEKKYPKYFQVPKQHEEDFKSVKKFNVFNTNNLWISLPAIQRVLEENTLDIEIIVNPKQAAGGVSVYQLETAVGAAIKCFG